MIVNKKDKFLAIIKYDERNNISEFDSLKESKMKCSMRAFFNKKVQLNSKILIENESGKTMHFEEEKLYDCINHFFENGYDEFYKKYEEFKKNEESKPETIIK